MKLTFQCMNTGMKVAGEGKIVYYAVFTKASEENLRHFGQLSLESFDPMHFKPGKKYNLNVTEHSGLIDVPLGTKIPNKMVN